LDARRCVNWQLGTADSFGDPDEQAHPIVNAEPASGLVRDENVCAC
jgi:hypothetical protein